MKIVVLAGGLSPERHVSLVTGQNVCAALRERGHRAVVMDMYLGLEGYEGAPEDVFDGAGLIGEAAISADAPDLEAVRRGRRDQSPSLFGPGALEVCRAADAECGEDGRVQAAFDLLGIPYTGSGHLSSGMAMNKAVTKQVMERLGIRTPAWREVRFEREDIPRLVEELPLPCAVKTINGGSSLGLALPETRGALTAALEEMLGYGGHVVVEEKVIGRDITVGVLGDRYLPAVEIIPKTADFFDYAAKYQEGGSEEVCPAPISEEAWRAMGEAALALHRGLGLEVYSRTDFVLDEAGRAWCLEINSLPGMTPGSLLPKEAAAVGMDYPALCEEILRLSLERRR